MTKKIAITKLENDQTEVGIQIRNGQPSSNIENRVHVDVLSGEMSVYSNGQKTALTVNILDEDPISPSEKQIWINRQSKTLKYKLGGVVSSINLPNSSISSTETTFDYLGTLTQVELKQVSPSTIPNYMVDDFSSLVGTLSNLEISNSALDVVGASGVGNYQYEKRSTVGINHAEGVIVTTAQALAPTGIVDNNDGTHTFVFKGNVTGFLRADKKCLMFEEETLSNNNKKSYYLLDAELKPAILTVVSESYNSSLNETTVIMNDNNLDLTMGFSGLNIKSKVRVYPFGVNMKVSGQGLAGTLVDFNIEEAHGVESAYRVLGEEVTAQLKTDIQGETVKSIGAFKSKNGLNWLVFAMVGKTFGTSIIKMWYSKDGLTTLNYVSNFTHQCELAGSERVNGRAIWATHEGRAEWFPVPKFHINNDGRFVFSLKYYSGSGFAQDRIYFGTMSGSDFKWAIPHQGFFSGGNGSIAFEHNSYDHVTTVLGIDWNTGMLFAPIGRPADSRGYIQFWELDFTNMLGYIRQYAPLFSGAVNEMQANSPQWGRVINFEGEDQFFLAVKHYNDHTYAYKFPVSAIFTATTRGSATSLTNANASTTFGKAFTEPASVEGGTRFFEYAYGHQNAGNSHTLDYFYDETNKVLHEIRKNDGFIELNSIDFGRTRNPLKPKNIFTFDQVPDSGNFTISLTQVTTSTTNTTTALPYSTTSSAIKSALEALAIVGAGNATVTGDFASGFTIELNKLEDYTMAVGANTLTNTAVAVVITNTVLVQGRKAIWLNYTNMASQANIYTPAKGNFVQLLVEQSTLNERFGQVDEIRNRPQTYNRAMAVRNNTVYCSSIIYEVGATNAISKAHFIKIPDFKTLFGVLYTSSMSGAFSKQRMGGTDNTFATSYAQIFTVPNVPYSGTLYPDSKIPVRTIDIGINKDWSDTNPMRNIPYSAYVQLKIVNVTGGLPDESSVIATSVTKIPVLEVDGCIGPVNDCMSFNFDNVKLTPASQVALIVEVVGLNMTSLVASNWIGVSFYANGSSHKKVNGVWTSQATLQMFFRIYDYYKICLNVNTPTFNKNIALAHGQRLDGYVANSHTECSLYPIGDYDTSKIFRNVFGVASSTVLDSSNYHASMGGRKNYYIDIDDSTVTAEQFPVIGEAKILDKNTSDFDENLVFAYIPAQDDETVKLSDMGQANSATSTAPDDKVYNIVSHVGDFYLLGDTTNYGHRLTKYTGQYAGLIEDLDFRYGKAKRGQTYLTARSGRNFFTPFARDFIIECEYKALNADASNTTATRYILVCEGAWNISLANGKYRFSIGAGNATTNTNYAWTTLETCDTGVYHRIRVTRDSVNGIKLFRNFSKSGGTWVELTWDGTQTALLNDLKNNTFVGISYTNAYRLGIGCDVDTNTNAIEGSIGYVKYALNTTTFAYSGVKYEPSCFNIFNYSDKVFAMRSRHSFAHSTFDYIGYGYKSSADTVVLTPSKETSLVKTHDQVFKFKQSVPQGTKMTVRIDLEKDGIKDPTAVQGYLVNFERK